jgi:uncharacterized protein (DUF488 family)
MTIIHTVGHSNQEIDVFIAKLKFNGVTAIADVRSHPASRRFPQFDKKALQASLEAAGIRYVYLGDGLGARPRDPSCYTDGRADFQKIRASDNFIDAMGRLHRGAQSFNISLMCAERDPADCHRTWLVTQTLHEGGTKVKHILDDEKSEWHESLLRRIAGTDSNMDSLFGDETEVMAATALREAQRVAYSPSITNDIEADE